ncbi:MAG TPA: response regulator [Microbacterium sp.]|uniref:response regulator n=1 Tax=Microbacterium sp. TaxID=51671 RepID=UPI002B482EFB|nr:response regulator [Microbacterium sp.]HKT58371.1 response regulator [Microbacterium sp.]
MIVDDDPRVARIHSQFVARTPGFAVESVVHSGQQAIDAVRTTHPDLALLDIHLPDINGLDLLRRWRAEGVTMGVIVITAAREVDAVRAALAGGAARYLIKPFEYPDLAETLRTFRVQHDAVHSLSSASQGDADRIFGHPAPAGGAPQPLPKGLSVETADLVRDALDDAPELSAAECADRLGISRVSVRRYLEHFVQTGDAKVRLQYGRSGRPVRYYRRR